MCHEPVVGQWPHWATQRIAQNGDEQCFWNTMLPATDDTATWSLLDTACHASVAKQGQLLGIEQPISACYIIGAESPCHALAAMQLKQCCTVEAILCNSSGTRQ